MYTKQDISRNKQAFWTAFGQYMQPILSADGEKVNWVNYKTGLPGVQFKMDADASKASIAITLSQTDLALQKRVYEQFIELKNLLHGTLGEEWQWKPQMADEYGKITSTIGIELNEVNINRSEDWPILISFFKSRIIALDAFWSNAKYGFIAL